MLHRARLLFIAVVLLLWTSVASATSSLSFSAQGYWVDMEIGRLERPVVASLHSHAPGDRDGVSLRGNFTVEVFDVDRKRLTIRYAGGDPRVRPFTLMVTGDNAVLSIGDERITTSFDWFM